MKRIFEVRPNTPIYHFGTEGTLELLVAYDKLGYNQWEANLYNKLLKQDRSDVFDKWISGQTVSGIEAMVLSVKPERVSFTRDRRHVFAKHRSVMLVVDQEKLSYNYKLVATRGDIDLSKPSEAEERVNRVINNISDYLLEIWVKPSTWKNFDFGKDLPLEMLDDEPENDSELSKQEQEYLEQLERVTTTQVERYCSSNGINLVIRNFV